jgi:hypothetical protein
MKSWDLHSSAGKIEMSMKTLRILIAAIDKQWADAAQRQFHTTYLAPIEPNVHNMSEAIGQLAEVLAAAERQCNDENE